MSYYIDIVDTTSPLTQVVIENASASGIVLKWNGGDTKDELAIVTSEFNFDMLTKTAQDAAFVQFFTGDEHRFKVLVKNNADDSVVWQGYILPDLYSEPYKNGCFFVSFTASDGLGRLKGKYLPEDYYSREKSLIDIYCQCLKLTGIELDLYFNPAIENFTNKDWNTIYIDTATFLDKDKKKDAYFILETLLKDTLCVCYQADNRWYVEGINTRHLRQVNYKIYDINGVFVSAFGYDRLLKNITALGVPVFTIIPPYNEIKITHKKTEPSLPKTLSKEVNDGWAIVTGVVGKIHASDWMANGGFYAFCERPDYYCIVYNKYYFTGSLTATYPQDDTQWISLKEKLFFAKGQKVKFEFDFKIKKFNVDVPNPENMELWKNPFKYEIVFNNEVIYSNFNGTVADQEKVLFNETGDAKLAIEHIFDAEGLFDIKLYGPTGKVFETKILGIQINSANIEVIGFQEEQIINDVINGEFTIDKEIELTYADDKSGVSNGFRLYKLKEQTLVFNQIEVLIFYGFELDGRKYAVVQLLGANLIKDNPNSVYKNGALVNVLNVFYNFNDGEQMVVETDVLYTSGSFVVKKYAIDDVLSSRVNWEQWTDSIYKIENSSYAKTVVNIYRRMFNQAHEKFDVVALNAVKFNDIVLFKYVYEKDFMVMNCSWNLDDNKTTLTLGRTHYKDNGSATPGDGNIPPIVLAGDDIYLTELQTTASAVANAYDPDGTIVSQNWTKTVGGFGDSIDSPFALATSFQNLTGDYYTYQIQVTDNDGATAVDSLNIIRIKGYTVTLDLVEVLPNAGAYDQEKNIRYKLNVSPELPIGFILKLTGNIELSVLVNESVGDGGSARYQVEKNGSTIESESVGSGGYVFPLTLNLIRTDNVYFILNTLAYYNGIASPSGEAKAAVQVNAATFISGTGTITDLPLILSQSVII